MTIDSSHHTLIIDIGKTHVKLHVLDCLYQSVFSKQMANIIDTTSIYPSANVVEIWDWICETISSVTKRLDIVKITITTHGATAALINRNIAPEGALVLPVLDYEYSQVQSATPDYENVRPAFADTFSPSLPAGLNLGRQLYWLKQQYPKEFMQATDILMYPQYWAWRFTGERVSEITSLGCHTDLWSINSNDYSSLLSTLGCEDLMPPIKPAWFNCGKVRNEMSVALGLNKDCQFYSGIHDSNASFLRYRLAQEGSPFTVVSTGTWTILMASQVLLGNLDSEKDMLANVDALGTPVACARFMGGREFETICEQAGSWLGEQFDEASLQNIIDRNVFALPDFSHGSGPFGEQKSGFVGLVDKVSGIALATMYCALMIDYQLEMLAAKGEVIIEGAFLKNPLLCAILNQIRTEQDVLLSQDATGTVSGASYLTHWGDVDAKLELVEASTTTLHGLFEYKQKWHALINA
jgi:sugar (pentulose or hexulose) kinase